VTVSARRSALEFALGGDDGKHAHVLKQLREEVFPAAVVLPVRKRLGKIFEGR
jgi:hypothetical protein